MIASWVIEPWESGYTSFMLPGLIGWMVSVAWWLRRKDRSLPIRLQVIFAFEVAVGAAVAYVAGRMDSSRYSLESGFFDPAVNDGNQLFMAKVALIGFGLHLLLLSITGILAFISPRKAPQD